MEKHWLKHEGNPKLILFFNGWGMDAAAVEHLDASGYDLLMYNNYTGLNTMVENLDSYHEVFVVAWSLGVWAASQVLSNNGIQINQSIAINGTLNPVDDYEGIPTAIFKGTLSGWAEKTRERFLMRMVGGAKEYLANQTKFGSRSIVDQKSELDSIFNQVQIKVESSFAFDKVLVGNQDAIFLPDNQRKSWQGKAELYSLDIPHFPFAHFTSWEQIISL